ncbi:MAG: hypothetical protein EOM21_14170 [Gammaproteobacteria bacterium]|nr:hypothetical protein [Gammaproteobacteria bacterium]
MSERHGCWRDTPLRHPWKPEICDTACGYDERMTHPKCAGCHRQREESPLDQLRALDARHTEDGLMKEPTKEPKS